MTMMTYSAANSELNALKNIEAACQDDHYTFCYALYEKDDDDDDDNVNYNNDGDDDDNDDDDDDDDDDDSDDDGAHRKVVVIIKLLYGHFMVTSVYAAIKSVR
uniref:Uncharacterized protein n=1 Tax=Glossina pallidipes TaxID=7398 RepID=A0A1A9ZE47_GLOPL